MVTRAYSCDHDRLRLLLEDGLGESDRVAVEKHLDECNSCCETLESFAGDDSWWKDASSLLTPIDGAAAGNEKPLRLLQSSPLSSVETMVGEMSLDFLEPSDSPAMLGRLGQYDIIEPLGCGGMGIVLKGYDQDLNRYVAIKVLAPHYATSSAARKRFAREAQASAAVVHPHVVAIHGVSSDSALPYLVMPYVQGESLQQRIDAAGPLKLKETLRISMQAAKGLQAAHEQGLVHRDIKPGNILLERGVDRVLLTDFGLARAVDDASMTRSGVIAGTPQYMSPEQARGDAVDHRSDLFSLGSVLYAMCAGRPPFRAESTMGLLNWIVEGSPRPIREVNPDVPEWLAAIIERLHSKPPEDRFESSGELADLLERCLAHVQQPQTQPLPDSLRIRRRSLPWSGLLTVLAGAAAAALFYAAWTLTGDRDAGAEDAGEVVAQPKGDAHHEGETKAAAENVRGLSAEFSPEGFSPWGELDGELNSITSDLNELNWELEVDLELSDESGADSEEGDTTSGDVEEETSNGDASRENSGDEKKPAGEEADSPGEADSEEIPSRKNRLELKQETES
jgi:serine/threonine-protein kinase